MPAGAERPQPTVQERCPLSDSAWTPPQNRASLLRKRSRPGGDRQHYGCRTSYPVTEQLVVVGHHADEQFGRKPCAEAFSIPNIPGGGAFEHPEHRFGASGDPPPKRLGCDLEAFIGQNVGSNVAHDNGIGQYLDHTDRPPPSHPPNALATASIETFAHILMRNL